MQRVILIISVLAVLFITGCLSETVLQIEIPTADGRVIKATYRRRGHQSMEGVTLTGPDGWSFGMEKQKSLFEIGFELGQMKMTAGGGQ